MEETCTTYIFYRSKGTTSMNIIAVLKYKVCASLTPDHHMWPPF